MAEVSRRRADQFRDLVRVLKFGTVDLNDGVRFVKEHLGRGLDDTRFAGAGRPEKQQCPDRTRRIIHPGEIDLKQTAHTPNRTFLTDDLSQEFVFKLGRSGTFTVGVE